MNVTVATPYKFQSSDFGGLNGSPECTLFSRIVKDSVVSRELVRESSDWF